MYIIIIYDLKDNQQKVNKICKKYLNWVQNSAFEGDITESKFKQLKKEINNNIEKNDSILIYTLKDKSNLNKEKIGNEKNVLSNFI